MATTWLDLRGPVSIYLDGEWKKGNLLDVRENHVVYSLGCDDDEFIITKDEARDIIRDRKTVSRTGKKGAYTGSNPLVFGPGGVSIYGKQIVKRKGRPKSYRVVINYKPLKYGKVQRLNLTIPGKHVNAISLFDFVCLFCLLLQLYVTNKNNSFYVRRTTSRLPKNYAIKQLPNG